MSRIAFACVLGLLAALAGRPAQAGPLYQYLFSQSNYTVAPGGTVAVTVSIQETFNPQTDTSLLAPGTDGLVGAGVLVQVVPPLPSSPAQVLAVGAIQGSLAFDLAQVPQLPAPGVPNSAGLLELATNPVFGTITSQTRTSETVLLPLGTFTFSAADVPGQVTSLLAMDTTINGIPSDNNVTNSGVVLDSLLQSGTATITVTGAVVPEVSGLILVLVGLSGAAIGYRRREWKS
jgi:hypothetical protein